jgi:hypothetical protein
MGVVRRDLRRRYRHRRRILIGEKLIWKEVVGRVALLLVMGALILLIWMMLLLSRGVLLMGRAGLLAEGLTVWIRVMRQLGVVGEAR